MLKETYTKDEKHVKYLSLSCTDPIKLKSSNEMEIKFRGKYNFQVERLKISV